jgi:NAD(P)-dependent dehydrogenase (short-subunit alcohol dehydrogenase family)
MNVAQQRDNRTLLAKLCVIVVAMFGFGYALVPFYEKICEATGLRNLASWEHGLDDGLRILRLGVDTHLITAHTLLPLLVIRPGGLHVEVTDGTKEYNDCTYRISVFYDLSKVAVNRLGYSIGHELDPFGATAVVVTPGWLRSEMMLDNWGVTEDNWHTSLDPGRSDGYPSPPIRRSAPRYVGRGVVAIADDIGRWNQRSVTRELAREYGFTD